MDLSLNLLRRIMGAAVNFRHESLGGRKRPPLPLRNAWTSGPSHAIREMPLARPSPGGCPAAIPSPNEQCPPGSPRAQRRAPNVRFDRAPEGRVRVGMMHMHQGDFGLPT